MRFSIPKNKNIFCGGALPLIYSHILVFSVPRFFTLPLNQNPGSAIDRVKWQLPLLQCRAAFESPMNCGVGSICYFDPSPIPSPSTKATTTTNATKIRQLPTSYTHVATVAYIQVLCHKQNRFSYVNINYSIYPTTILCTVSTLL